MGSFHPSIFPANPAKLTEMDFSEFIWETSAASPALQDCQCQQFAYHKHVTPRASDFSPPLQQMGRTHVRLNGRKLIYFGGCDYFRLSRHPKVISAIEEGLRQFGLNPAASRFTTGNHVIYEELEEGLRGFFLTESATLASTGYATNLVVAQALQGEFTHALIDSRAHQSLQDSAAFLGVSGHFLRAS